jgi:hypothetical protein
LILEKLKQRLNNLRSCLIFVDCKSQNVTIQKFRVGIIQWIIMIWGSIYQKLGVLPYEVLVSLHSKSLLELVGNVQSKALHLGRVEHRLQI